MIIFPVSVFFSEEFKLIFYHVPRTIFQYLLSVLKIETVCQTYFPPSDNCGHFSGMFNNSQFSAREFRVISLFPGPFIFHFHRIFFSELILYIYWYLQ